MEESIYLGDNLDVLPRFPDGSFQLIYIDPPFNTGKRQTRRTLRGRGGRGRRPHRLQGPALRDATARGALIPRRVRRLPRLPRAAPARGAPPAARRRARSTSTSTTARRTTASCCSTRSSAASSFLNEIIWAYDYGARAKRRWPAKHDTILVYVKDPERYYFDSEAVDREPYMAPGLVTPEKAARGKLPTDVWWHTIVPTNGQGEDRLPDAEAPGHPAADACRRRRARATGASTSSPAAGRSARSPPSSGRRYVLIDSNPESVRVMHQRLAA